MRTLIPVDRHSRDPLGSLISAANAVSQGDEVHVLYVVPADPHAGYRGLTEDVRKLSAEREHLAELAVHAGLGRAIVHVRHGLGSVGREVADYARSRGISRIVVPSRQRQGVARWLWGSVAAEITREASIPVAVVPVRPALSLVMPSENARIQPEVA